MNTMHGRLHPRSNVQGIYFIPRNAGELISAKSFIDRENRCVTRCAGKSTERLVRSAAEKLNFVRSVNRLSNKARSEARLQEWQKKAFYG